MLMYIKKISKDKEQKKVKLVDFTTGGKTLIIEAVFKKEQYFPLQKDDITNIDIINSLKPIKIQVKKGCY